jgi:hypothetical protein
MTSNRRGQRDARGGATGSIVQGVARLACFRVGGLEQLPATPQAFLNSLAPLIAFPLVGSALMLLGGGGETALADLLATLVAVLTPSVLSERLAALWRRDAAWLRYAVAFNWCQWAIPFAAIALLFAVGVLMAAGLPDWTAAAAAMFGLVSYALGLHWFLARCGLGLSRLQATVFVVAVNVGTGVLVMGPRLLVSLTVWEPTR